jgi:hypothetical protein
VERPSALATFFEKTGWDQREHEAGKPMTGSINTSEKEDE